MKVLENIKLYLFTRKMCREMEDDFIESITDTEGITKENDEDIK